MAIEIRFSTGYYRMYKVYRFCLQMSVIISNCVDILMSRLQTHSEKNETVDIYR